MGKALGTERWRVISLVGVHVFFVLHFVHWKLHGRTLAPLELNEVLYTLHQGIVTAGFILMALVMLATLVFGRFFCSWGCHILALQDACAWLMRKAGIKPVVVRSRALVWIPLGAMFYLFIWPQILTAFHGVDRSGLHVVEASAGGWSSFMTDDLWRNLPPASVAISTFAICGFLLVYLLGSRSFCFNGCPYGALFGIADQFAPGRIVLKGNCTDCGLCTAACTSDILVHREVKQHGMVSNPRCLKDLDCVAACPEKALSFGFTTPPLFRKGHLLGQYPDRFSFTLREDILLAAVFLFGLWVYRGLYDSVPFLLSIGIAICLGFASVMTLRLFTSEHVSLRKSRLKQGARLSVAGFGFLAIALPFIASTLHGAFIQYHQQRGRVLYASLVAIDGSHAARTGQDAIIGKAVGHLQAVYDHGWMRSLDLEKQLANLFWLSGNAARSKEHLTAILATDPENVEAMYRMGSIAMRIGDHAQALRSFEEVLAKDGQGKAGDRLIFAAAGFELGRMAARGGRLDEAIQLHERAARLDPAHVENLVALGSLCYRQGELHQAIDAFTKALAISPGLALCHNNLGAIYVRLGDDERAIQHFERLLSSKPEDAGALYTLGMLHHRAGRSALARSYLQRTLRAQPGHARAPQILAILNGNDEGPEPPNITAP